MSIVTPVVLMSIGILLFAVTLILARNPHKHWWGSELMTASIYVPAVIGFATIGLIQFIRSIFIHPEGLTFGSIAVSVIIVIATVVIVKLMDIKKRLARYENLNAEAEVVQMPAPAQADKHDTPPAKAA